jgi:hypothetical protein
MRTTKETREMLERAAATSGRSLVQEVEHRLESSFRDEAFFELAGDAEAQKIVRPIVYYLGIMKHRGLDWRSNRGATAAVRDSVALIIEAGFSDAPLSQERQNAFLTDCNAKRRGTIANEAVLQVLHVLQVSGLAEHGMPAAVLKARK